MGAQELLATIRAKIERRIKELDNDKYINLDAKACRVSELGFLKRFLDSLSVDAPEVFDFEKELEAYHQGYWPKTDNGDESLTYSPNAIRRLVAHFFELGLSERPDTPDFPTTDKEMEKFLANTPPVEVPDKYKNPDWLFKRPMKDAPKVDLEKEIDEYTLSCQGALEGQQGQCWDFDWEDITMVIDEAARYFYELGKNAK